MMNLKNKVSMKDNIRMKTDEVSRILSDSNITDDQKVVIMDTIQDFAYQWCVSDSFLCAVEHILKVECPDLNGKHLVQRIVVDGIQAKKINETLPLLS